MRIRTIATSTTALWLIVVFLGIGALRPIIQPRHTVLADAAKFDHVSIIAPVFLYKGLQGMLLLDTRNANIWFMAKGDDTMMLKYSDPVFVTKLPLEKLDHPPR